MDKGYVVVVKRACSAIKWSCVWVSTLSLTAMKLGTTHTHLFEPIKNSLRCPHCSRGGITLHNIQSFVGSGLYGTLTLFFISSLTGLVSDSWAVHVFSHQKDSPCAISKHWEWNPYSHSCAIHLVNSHSSFRLRWHFSYKVLPNPTLMSTQLIGSSSWTTPHCTLCLCVFTFDTNTYISKSGNWIYLLNVYLAHEIKGWRCSSFSP